MKKRLLSILLAFSLFTATPLAAFAGGINGPESAVLGAASGTFEYENLLLMAIMNHQYEGGGVHFAPEADATDGLLDLCVAAPKHRSYFYQALPYAMVGQHEKLAYITPIKTSSLEARVSVPMWVQTDGEVLPQSQHIKVRVLEKKLQSLM